MVFVAINNVIPDLRLPVTKLKLWMMEDHLIVTSPPIDHLPSSLPKKSLLG